MRQISRKLSDWHRQNQPHLLERPQLCIILPYLSSALIITGRVVSTAIKKKVRLTTNRATILDHIIKRENGTPQRFDSADWDSVTTAIAKEPDADQARIVKFSHGWLAM